MKQRNLRTWAGIPAMILAGLLPGSMLAKAADTPDSEQVSKLLSEAKTLAYQVKTDAEIMESFTRSNVSWEGHAAAVSQIREHINALGRQVAKLNAAKGEASPWQKTAIDRINPFLDELGGYTSAVIDRLNGDRTHSLAEYNDYLEANVDYATDLTAMIGDFVDYGKTKQRLERLSSKLEIHPAE